jgi:hypothetical protein
MIVFFPSVISMLMVWLLLDFFNNEEPTLIESTDFLLYSFDIFSFL